MNGIRKSALMTQDQKQLRPQQPTQKQLRPQQPTKIYSTDLAPPVTNDAGVATDDGNPHDHGTAQELSTFTDSMNDDSKPILLNTIKSKAMALQPSDIRRVLSDSVPTSNRAPKFKVNAHITYSVSQRIRATSSGALVDRGANGGIADNDVWVITKTDWTADVSGIDNHEMNNLPIVTVGGVVKTQRGQIIVVINQMAQISQGKTILSAVQMESFGISVDDRSLRMDRPATSDYSRRLCFTLGFY